MNDRDDRTGMTGTPLELDEEAMRRLGYRVVDAIVDHRRQRRVPVSDVVSRREADRLLAEPMPESASDPEALVDFLVEHVLSRISHVDDPRFFAFVPGPSNYVSALADALAAGHNVFAGTWLGGSSAAAVELTVVSWLRDACGLPESGGGLFLSGGSMANLTGISAARHDRLGDMSQQGVIYYSDQTHSAVTRALRVLGFPPENIRILPAGRGFTLDPAVLEEAVSADLSAGRRPFCVVANAGTTNTGAVDPMPGMSEIARRHGLWLHVDGAYGAAAVLSRRGKDALRGLELADSIALDPHKWLFQPFECGCLLVRDVSILRRAFAIHPEYMQDTLREPEEVNLAEYGVQLSRSFRALKVWMSLKTFGRAEFARAIENGFTMADHAAGRLASMDGWEVVSAPSMAILAFRHTGSAHPDELNRRLADRLRESGTAMVSTTVLGGETVLRLCPINPRTTAEDIDVTLEALDRLAREMS